MNNLYNIGVEREGLRSNQNGELSDLPHPSVFGDKIKNHFIGTDFGEAQVEVCTPVCHSVRECYEKLSEITNVVLCELYNRNEVLWPYSMPCILPSDDKYIFNEYGDYQDEIDYENKLYKKYGTEMYAMSGIHVNFSMEDELVKRLQELYPEANISDDKEEDYFKIMRNFRKGCWMLEYLTGSTPYDILHEDRDAMISLRGSKTYGFHNKNGGFTIDFTDKDAYIRNIEKLLADDLIYSDREVYICIRAKSSVRHASIKNMKKAPVDHIEGRIFDLNPFDRCGCSKADMELATAFFIYCLITDEDKMPEYDYMLIAETGIDDKQKAMVKKMLNKLVKLSEELYLGFGDLKEFINDINKDTVRYTKVRAMGHKNLKEELLKLARGYAAYADENCYMIPEYPNLETATAMCIKDAIACGINYNIIDENKSIVEYEYDNKKECTIQATKTSADSYIFPYITDDKIYAKKLMMANGIKTANYVEIDTRMPKNEVNALLKSLVGKKIVVKPKSSNYGRGITVLKEDVTLDKIKAAVKMAFKEDSSIFIEDYAPGKEYRFLVVDGKCLSVVWRRPASVVGDGIHTIRELIEIKKQIPRFRKINKDIPINEAMLQYLKEQNITLDTIPKDGERVWIQKVSNASMGGEPIAVTEDVPDYLKAVAEKMADIFHAKICGIDFIIDDMDKPQDYIILEINDNPGIFLNEVPTEGTPVKVGMEIFKMLGLYDI